MKCKRALMGVAALLIVIFHFWMPLTTSTLETSIFRSTYLGVDIFFFVSAYSISQKKSIEYVKFIFNRCVYVYIPFFVLAIICGIYRKWDIVHFIKVVSGVEFFKKGGGAFLWFLVAIMLLYLIAPGILAAKRKLKWKTLIFALAGWIVIVCVLQFVLGYTAIFILLNRIPIFMLGFYYDDIRKLYFNKKPFLKIIAGLLAGAIIIFYFCGSVRISRPITDIYYVLVIPFTVHLALLFDYIADSTDIEAVFLNFIGTITLELYGIQMIFGYDVEKMLFRVIKGTVFPMGISKILTFVLTAVVLIIIAWIFSVLKKIIIGKVVKRRD